MTSRKIRVLHIVGGMGFGGVETWLMHVLRNIDKERIQMDFLVHTEEERPYDAEIRALGSRIFHCPYPDSLSRYGTRLQAILREYGPFDVVHSHVHYFSGVTLLLARLLGIKHRIAHSHNDFSRENRSASAPRKLYTWLSKRLIQENATMGFATSSLAADDLYGRRWSSDARWKLLYCGIDCDQIKQAPLVDLRREFGIAATSRIFAHVGRFAPQKNHRFLVAVAAEIIKRDPLATFLLIGSGPLLSTVQQSVAESGLAESFVFPGVRSDIASVFRNAADVFIFPSLHEGLGLVLLEAQASGVPCLYSDTLPHEVDIVPQNSRRMSLQADAGAWADAAIALAEKPGMLGRTECLAMIQDGPLDAIYSVKALEEVYLHESR